MAVLTQREVDHGVRAALRLTLFPFFQSWFKRSKKGNLWKGGGNRFKIFLIRSNGLPRCRRRKPEIRPWHRSSSTTALNCRRPRFSSSWRAVWEFLVLWLLTMSASTKISKFLNEAGADLSQFFHGDFYGDFSQFFSWWFSWFFFSVFSWWFLWVDFKASNVFFFLIFFRYYNSMFDTLQQQNSSYPVNMTDADAFQYQTAVAESAQKVATVVARTIYQFITGRNLTLEASANTVIIKQCNYFLAKHQTGYWKKNSFFLFFFRIFLLISSFS